MHANGYLLILFDGHRHGFGFMVERASKTIKYITYELTLFLFAILAASSLHIA